RSAPARINSQFRTDAALAHQPTAIRAARANSIRGAGVGASNRCTAHALGAGTISGRAAKLRYTGRPAHPIERAERRVWRCVRRSTIARRYSRRCGTTARPHIFAAAATRLWHAGLPAAAAYGAIARIRTWTANGRSDDAGCPHA